MLYVSQFYLSKAEKESSITTVSRESSLMYIWTHISPPYPYVFLVESLYVCVQALSYAWFFAAT